MTQYIADIDHYSHVIAQIPKVKRLLWIATADLKDLYVEKKDKTVVPLLQVLNDLVKKVLKFDYSTPKSLDNHSEKTSTNILPYGEEWNGTCVRVYT